MKQWLKVMTTTMQTSVGLPQGATNSVAHMINAMNKVLCDCTPEIMMPFLWIQKDETVDDRECPKFVTSHIRESEKVLRKLEDAELTLSGEKSALARKRYW